MQQTLSVINLSAIQKNAVTVKQKAQNRPLYAVVKADAYGHGAERVSLALQNIADSFCVSLMQEGAALRIAGITKPILVFTPPLDREDADIASFYNLAVTVTGEKSARLSKGLDCHIKVNTGMNRHGCNVDALEDLLKRNLHVTGVYSHLYAAEDRAASMRQLTLFKQAEELTKTYYPEAVAHIAASGGILLGKDFLMDAVRCGIMLYGYPPQGFAMQGLTTAMKVFARRTQSTDFIGGGIGYSKATKNYNKLTTYRAGYADGFFRTTPLGEGNLCMDAFISQSKGEWTEIFADAAAYAKNSGAISYEVLCRATQRSRRVYVT